VALANFTPSIEDLQSKLVETRNVVQKITNTNGSVNTRWLEGIVDLLTNQLVASGSYTNAQVLNGKGILLENTNEASTDFGALYLGPGIFAIASEKDGSNEWVWRTFGTGTGFTADELNAGKINTSAIKIEGSTNFYWDEENIFIVNPGDANQQVRLGKYDGTHYGIGFTTNGGSTWSVVLDSTGLTATGTNLRTIMSGATPLRVQKKNGGSWVDVMVADDATGQFKLSIIHSNGTKTEIDGTGFKIYPDSTDNTKYTGVNSKGLFVAAGGMTANYKIGVKTGTAVSAGLHGPPQLGDSISFGSAVGSLPAPHTYTIDLIGAMWYGRVDDLEFNVSLVGTYYNSYFGNSTNNYQQTVSLSVLSKTAIANGIRVVVQTQALLYYPSSPPLYYDWDVTFAWSASA
jgi:hypothetical protein